MGFDVVYVQMKDVKSILVASERLFGASDPSEMMRQTQAVTEVCSSVLLYVR